MEKRKAHYPLSQVKALIRSGAYQVTRTALLCATRDFRCAEPSQVAGHILKIEARDFYKSMTTLNDSTLWQDVYRPVIEDTAAYVKLQIVDARTVVISFKASEDDSYAH